MIVKHVQMNHCDGLHPRIWFERYVGANIDEKEKI